MTGLTIFSLFSDFACSSSKYASDPIDITNHEMDDDQSQGEKENSMRIFMHQNSIAACDRRVRNETSTISTKRDSSKQVLLQRTTLAPVASQPAVDVTFQKNPQQVIRKGNEECMESRDDTIGTVSSFMDEDLVVAHPSRTDDDEVRDEAIEVINISYIHE